MAEKTKKEEQEEEMKKMGFFYDGRYKWDSKELQEHVNFVAQDGGETRQLTAYKDDGETEIEGMIDFWWK
jgi:hypothetical protein